MKTQTSTYQPAQSSSPTSLEGSDSEVGSPVVSEASKSLLAAYGYGSSSPLMQQHVHATSTYQPAQSSSPTSLEGSQVASLLAEYGHGQRAYAPLAYRPMLSDGMGGGQHAGIHALPAYNQFVTESIRELRSTESASTLGASVLRVTGSHAAAEMSRGAGTGIDTRGRTRSKSQ